MGINNIQGPNGDAMAPQNHHIQAGVERSREAAQSGSNVDALRSHVQSEQARFAAARTEQANIQATQQQRQVDKDITTKSAELNQRFGTGSDVRQSQAPNTVTANSETARAEMQPRNMPAMPTLAPGSSANNVAMANLPPSSTVQAAAQAAQTGATLPTSASMTTNAQAAMALNPRSAPPPVTVISNAQMQLIRPQVTGFETKMRANHRIGKRSKKEEEEAEESAKKHKSGMAARMIKLARLLMRL